MSIFFSHIGVIVLKALSYLPLRVLFVFSDILFFIVYYVARYRRPVTKKNLENSFPEKSKEEIKQIERKFYQHFCDLFFETIKLYTISKEELRKRCLIINEEIFNQYIQGHRSVIVIQGHYCNWEWAPAAVSSVPHQILSVYKPLHNKPMESYLITLRERFGPKTLAMKHALRTVAKKQKDNELIAVGLVADQTPQNTNNSYWSTFLNQQTPFMQGPEHMAKMFDLPVIFIKATKRKRGYYELEAITLTNNPKDTAPHEITEKHIHALEAMIKENPQYWLWSHRRWKRSKKHV